jgi:hypothetical protein
MNGNEPSIKTDPPSRARFAWVEWLSALLCLLFLEDVGFLVYSDKFAPSSISNRSFAGPALGMAGVLATYAVWRFRALPLLVRGFGWPALMVLLYFGFGFIFILVDSFLR